MTRLYDSINTDLCSKRQDRGAHRDLAVLNTNQY
jgi:hypothetical protein